jgi:hypothetical protein
MANGNPLPLEDVLSRPGALEWSHVVAITLQLVDQLTPSRQEPVGVFPDVDRIALSPTGFLLTQFESGGDEPLAGLGRLLHRLLAQTSPPAALRLVAMRACAAHPTISFEELIRELVKWDGPERLASLSDLYKRATGEVAIPAPEAPKKSRPLFKRRSRDQATRSGRLPGLVPQVVIAAAGAVAVSVVATYVWHGPSLSREPLRVVPTPAIPIVEIDVAAAGLGPSVPPRNTVLETTTAGIVSGGAAASDVVNHSTPARRASTGLAPASHSSPESGAALPIASQSPAVVAALTAPPSLPATPEAIVYSPAVMREAEEQFRRARALFERHEYGAAAAAFRQVVVVLEKGDPTLELRQIAAELAGASRALSSPATARARNEVTPVYTSADEAVTEPVALAYMPAAARPGTPAEQVGVLELLIDARGRVESAHLVGVGHQFRDRWWISAAKAWLFEPAMKEGQPVRFLKRHTFLLNQVPGS